MTEEKSLRVEIYNQTYSIRSDGDNQYILNLADYVDKKMRDISSGTLTVDSLKVAILAALLLPAACLLPVEGVGRALMIASVLLVLVVELLNSGLEATVDRIGLEDHRLAKRAKDIGSAAVLVALVNVAAVWASVLLP